MDVEDDDGHDGSISGMRYDDRNFERTEDWWSNVWWNDEPVMIYVFGNVSLLVFKFEFQISRENYYSDVLDSGTFNKWTI